MSLLEKDIEKYLKKIKTLLPNGSYEKIFLQDLEADIFALVNENKINDFTDLQNNFGSPNKVAGDFLAGMSDTDANYMLKQKSRKRIIRLSVTCFIALFITSVIIITTYFGLYYYKAYKHFQEFTLTNEETELEIID